MLEYKKIDDILSPIPKGSEVSVITSSGSFSPPHKMHLKMLEEAKLHLEKKGEKVIACILAPSTEEYVKMKLRNDAIEYKDRLEMCRILCKNSKYISVTEIYSCNGYEVRKLTKYYLKQHYNYQYKFKVYSIFGADYYYRYPTAIMYGKNLIAYLRPGYDLKKLKAFVDEESFSKLEIVNGQQNDLSSTKIRELIHQNKINEITQMTSPEILDYIIKINLYDCKKYINK